VNTPEPSLSFRELLAYSDYLAQRWMNYFRQNPKALDIEVGGRTPTLLDLATHIFQVEQFFTDLLLKEGAGATGRPAQMEAPELSQLENMHRETHNKLAGYIAYVPEETLGKTRTLGPRTISNRKILAQIFLHGVHHWAQVAMAVRQAGFPAESPQDIIASPVMR
jgi:uncharacterized damage-inducible protein DinB